MINVNDHVRIVGTERVITGVVTNVYYKTPRANVWVVKLDADANKSMLVPGSLLEVIA